MVEANLSTLLPTFILLLIFIKLLNKTRTKSNLPPSPPSFPIIGHLHLLKQPLHESLHKLSRKFGPVMLLRFGIQRVVIVTSPSIVEECFTKSNDTVFANRPMSSPCIKIINYNFTTMGTAPYGPLWRSLRRFCASELLSTTRLDATNHSREHEVKLLCRHILKESSSSPKVVELKVRFSDLLNNITTMAVMGKRYHGDLIDMSDIESASTFREMMEEMFRLLHAPKLGDFLPALRRVVDIGNIEKRSLDLMKIVNDFLEEYIKERRRIGCRVSGIMVDNMLVLQEEEPELYTDEIIKGLILILLVSGTETPYLALEWSMSLLLNNTNAMEKVKNEIDVHVGSNRLIQENDLCKLSYLQNVINESLRLYPTVPVLFPREASEDVKIGGYLVPRGTTLMVNAWAIHRDPLLWDKPDEFIPERFEQNLENKYKLLPFGVGRRGCPGTNLGYRVLGLALGTLIQAFEWENIGGEEIDMTASYGLSMSKLKPLQAFCKPRSDMIKHFL